MILGLSESNFLVLHVGLSLAGILTGLIAAFAMAGGRRAGLWTALFLLTTILTSAGGFLLPGQAFDPAQVVGALSLVLLALAVLSRYIFRLRAAWRPIYVLTAIAALDLNCFVGVVQSFQKIPFLAELAPMGNEPPFLIAQGAVLLLLVILAILALRRFPAKG